MTSHKPSWVLCNSCGVGNYTSLGAWPLHYQRQPTAGYERHPVRAHSPIASTPRFGLKRWYLFEYHRLEFSQPWPQMQCTCHLALFQIFFRLCLLGWVLLTQKIAIITYYFEQFCAQKTKSDWRLMFWNINIYIPKSRKISKWVWFSTFIYL